MRERVGKINGFWQRLLREEDKKEKEKGGGEEEISLHPFIFTKPIFTISFAKAKPVVIPSPKETD